MIFAHLNSHFSNSFWEGLIHPLSGWDHLLMLVSIGFLSVYFIKLQKRILGGNVLGLLLGGGVGTVFQSTQIFEVLIGVTLLLGGYFLTLGTREGKAPPIASLVGGIGLVHGMAHGMEFKGADPFSFFMGMLIASFIISSVVSYFLCFKKQEWRLAFVFVGVLTIVGGCIKMIGFNL